MNIDFLYFSRYFAHLLAAVGILGMALLIVRTALVTIKEKRPGMDWFDRAVYAVFLGLFATSFLLLITLGITDAFVL